MPPIEATRDDVMTTRKLIGLGNKTTTGGVVLTAYLDMQIYNRGTATEGCLASCGKCGQTDPIEVIEKVGITVNGNMAAREGDLVLCACGRNPGHPPF
ncbi:MAG: PAAR domain-containing protein [Aeromonas veronii]